MMSTPKPLHDTSADRSTKVMGLALRDVNESLAGSLGKNPGTFPKSWVCEYFAGLV